MDEPISQYDSNAPETGPGSSSRRRWFLGASALLVVAALWMARDVLLPFLLAIIVAYVFSPVVEVGERIRIGGKAPPRWVIVLALYVALIGALSGLVATATPRLAVEFRRLATDAPAAVNTLRERWLPQIEHYLKATSALYAGESQTAEEGQEATAAAPAGPRPEAAHKGEAGTAVAAAAAKPPAIVVRPTADGGYQVELPPEGLNVVPTPDGGYQVRARPQLADTDSDLTANIIDAVSRTMESTEQGALGVLKAAQQLVAALARGIFGGVMMLMISAYLLISTDRIFEFFRTLYPVGRRHQFDDLVQRMDRGLAGVVRGQLMICLVNGLLSGIGFYALGLKYWVFLTLLATTMSIIPIFGAILSTIPAVLMALPQGLGTALLVTGWIILVHQIEANLLNPKIMGDSARVHPVLVVFVLLAGEHVAGFAGALLAVPTLSIVQTLFFYLRERFLGVPRSPSTPPPPMMPSATGQSDRPTAMTATE